MKTKSMQSDFSNVRHEAQDWVSGMGESIKDNSLLGGYYRKKDAVRLLNKTRVPRNLGVVKTARGHVHKYYILKGSGD